MNGKFKDNAIAVGRDLLNKHAHANAALQYLHRYFTITSPLYKH
jgi:hypothetical protein